jgi:hypothetical protein
LDKKLLAKKYGIAENQESVSKLKDLYAEEAAKLEQTQSKQKEELTEIFNDIANSDTFDWF